MTTPSEIGAAAARSLLPIADAPKQGGHLRLAPTANNQRAGVRFASDYEIRPPA